MTAGALQSGSSGEALLAWSENGLLDQIDVALYAVDEHGYCRRLNRAAEHLFGYTQHEVLGRNLHDLVHSRHPDGSPYQQERCSLLDTIRTGKNASSIHEVMWSRTGEALPVECSVGHIEMDGRPGAVITLKDMRPQAQADAVLRTVRGEAAELLRQRDAASAVEREQASAEAMRHRELALQVERAATDKLREQQELLQHVIDAAPVGIAVTDADLRFRWYNHAFGEILEKSDLTANEPVKSLTGLVTSSPELQRIFETVRREGTPFFDAAFRFDTKTHEKRYWNWSLTRLHGGDLLLTSMDVTEQSLAQQALVHSDKMAAVGRLAASISHEINNPLEAVTNLLYLVGCDEALSDTSKEYIDMAQTELSRVSRIASQTLRFHRHEKEAVTRTHQQLIEPVLALYEGKLKHAKVKVTVDYRNGEPLKTYEGDVRQILNNLIGNAIEAMEKGGELRIRMRTMNCARTGRAGTRVTITDSGHGMKPETAARVFEPFYTTKGASGSGLGLWISHTLAERHGGKLAVKSCTQDNAYGRPHGTTFSLFLPQQEQTATTLQ